MSQPRKNPGAAVVLSFFIPGLGQIYNGQIMKGIVFIILASIFGFLTVVLIGYVLYHCSGFITSTMLTILREKLMKGMAGTTKPA